jgi:hypothetical protein
MPRRSEIIIFVLIALLAASLVGITPQPKSLAFPDVFPAFNSYCGGVALPC